MNLPILESPKYTLKIPSTGKQIEYRPFLVKEEKILLLAQESDNANSVMRAISDVVQACTFEKVDVKNLTTFDLEYIFLKLRTKSVGEVSEIGVKCEKCGTSNPIQVNLDKIEVVGEPPESNKIQLSDDVGIVMRYISADAMARISECGDDNARLISETVIASIESIFDKTAVYPTVDASQADLETFINSLNRSQMSKIEAFIESTPKLQETVEFDCSKCEQHNTIKLAGAQSFFA